MLEGGFLFFVSVLYLGLLFAVAHWGDRFAARWRPTRLAPIVYALSLAVYATSWTFYGSVGTAATAGLDFLPIYIGPILMFVFGFPVLRKIAEVTRRQNITSIADFIGSRYGKSQHMAALVACGAVIGALAYIALQLKAVSVSFDVLVGYYQGPTALRPNLPLLNDTAFYVALLMAAFSILFGVRYIHASEHHVGMVLAIAFESLIKLVAFLAVGIFVTFGLFDGIGDMMVQAAASQRVQEVFQADLFQPGWVSVTLIAAAAIFCLPRQFHVAFVENDDPRSLRTARVLFPIYLVAINLFVVPIAVGGMILLDGTGIDADTFVLTLPLSTGAEVLSIFAFLGGLSAATSMVIVATVALSTMVCNDLVVPLLLRHPKLQSRMGRDLSGLLLRIRRSAIVVILLLAYAYYRLVSEDYALARIGLLSFSAVAQFAPALIAALYWKGANRTGARWGLVGGFAVWAYTLLIPSFVQAGWLSDGLLIDGPLGIANLRPYALFGVDGLDPVTHGVMWSLAINTGLLLFGSLVGAQGLTQRRQARNFVDVYRGDEGGESRPWIGHVSLRELQDLTARFLGVQWAERAFQTYLAGRPDAQGMDAAADVDAAHFTEHLLSGAIGAASARVVMALLLPEKAMSRRDAMELLDEASEAIKFNRDLLLKTLENISQGVGVFDRNLRLATWNQRFLDLLGMPDHLAKVTTPLSELVVFSKMGGASSVDIDMLLARNVAPQMRRLPHSYERRRADGTVLEIRTNPMPDGGFVATISDITARVRTEEALRDSERNIRIYTDNVPVLIAYADARERLRFTNRPYERALGLTRSQAQGMAVRDALGPARYDLVRAHIDEVLKGRRQSFEVGFPPNEAGIRFAQGTYIPHFNETGAVIGYFCIYTDITERRAAEQALKEANESLELRVRARTAELERLNTQLAQAKQQAERANDTKTRFFAAASHDLLQPLNAARLFNVALAGLKLDGDARNLVEKTDLSLKGVEELLNELLDICKLDAGAMTPTVSSFPIGRLLRRLEVEFAPFAEQKKLRFKVRDSGLWVRSDARLLRRILQNFVSNALRYTQRGGVLVGGQRRGEMLRLGVWDTGPGIPEDKIKLIFEEFHRLEGASESESKGLGLGLAIVERMGRALDHRIGVSSVPGRGTLFSVDVPLGVPQLGVVSARHTGQRLGTGALAGCRVLCVDNEADILDGMAAMLSQWGCVVTTARDLDQARAAMAETPDLMLVDYHLDRGVTGIVVMDHLRAEGVPECPGIVITADRGLEVAEAARARGYGLLNKPLRPAKLRALAVKMLQSRAVPADDDDDYASMAGG